MNKKIRTIILIVTIMALLLPIQVLAAKSTYTIINETNQEQECIVFNKGSFFARLLGFKTKTSFQKFPPNSQKEYSDHALSMENATGSGSCKIVDGGTYIFKTKTEPNGRISSVLSQKAQG